MDLEPPGSFERDPPSILLKVSKNVFDALEGVDAWKIIGKVTISYSYSK